MFGMLSTSRRNESQTLCNSRVASSCVHESGGDKLAKLAAPVAVEASETSELFVPGVAGDLQETIEMYRRRIFVRRDACRATAGPVVEAGLWPDKSSQNESDPFGLRSNLENKPTVKAFEVFVDRAKQRQSGTVCLCGVHDNFLAGGVGNTHGLLAHLQSLSCLESTTKGRQYYIGDLQYTAIVYLRNSSLQQFPQSVIVKGKARFPRLVPCKANSIQPTPTSSKTCCWQSASSSSSSKKYKSTS